MLNPRKDLTDMDFGKALHLLLQGYALRRRGWEEGRFIYYVPAADYKACTKIAKKFAKEGNLVPYGAYIAEMNKNLYVSPWVAAQYDILGNDWVVRE